MTRPAGIPDEFWALLDAACDGELAAADQARLEAYLSGNPDAHRAFVDHVRLRLAHPPLVERGALAPGGLGSGRSSE